MSESTHELLLVCNQAIERAARILKGDHQALSGFGALRDRALGIESSAFADSLGESSEIGAALIVGSGGTWPSPKLAARIAKDLERLVARRSVLLAIRAGEEALRNALPPPVENERHLDPSDKKILNLLSKCSNPINTNGIAQSTGLKKRSIGKNLTWMAKARPPLVTNEPRIGYRITIEGLRILKPKS